METTQLPADGSTLMVSTDLTQLSSPKRVSARGRSYSVTV